jgi:MoxR-like ATPase
MFNIFVDYPDETEENTIIRTTTSAATSELKPVMSAEKIKQLQQLVRRVPVAEHVIAFAVGLARATRPNQNSPLPYIKDWVSWGAGPRAGQYLILGAKCRAILDGRPTPSVDDVRAVARPVFRHRIVTSFNAEADGIGTLDIVEKLLVDVKAKE